MPEIWINYGTDEAVLEIMAENLAQTIRSGSTPLFDAPADENTSPSATDAAPGSTQDDTDAKDSDSDDGHNTSGASTNNENEDAKAAGDEDIAAADTGSKSDTADATGGRPTGKYPDASPAAASLPQPPRGSASADHTSPRLDPDGIAKRLDALDLSSPFDLVLMHDSQAVRQVVSSIFVMCERRGVPFPGIMADRHILSGIKTGLPEGSVLEEFVSRTLDATVLGGGTGDMSTVNQMVSRDAVPDAVPDAGNGLHHHDDSNHIPQGPSANSSDAPGKPAGPAALAKGLVFVAETEFDGLFGYETVATRLVRKFGADEMLAAYAKRNGNDPSPGKRAGGFDAAARFADRFEIGGIDIVANSDGIHDLFVGHPSKTTYDASASLESKSILDIEPQKAMIISTGKSSSSATLGDALSSVWNCQGAMRNNGLCVLVAECSRGLGPDAVRMHVEGVLDSEVLQNPPAYVDGMEDMLFLQEARRRFQIALVSVLPEMYTSRLGIVSIAGMRDAVEYIKKTQGARQKALIVKDGSRLLLR